MLRQYTRIPQDIVCLHILGNRFRTWPLIFIRFLQPIQWLAAPFGSFFRKQQQRFCRQRQPFILRHHYRRSLACMCVCVCACTAAPKGSSARSTCRLVVFTPHFPFRFPNDVEHKRRHVKCKISTEIRRANTHSFTSVKTNADRCQLLNLDRTTSSVSHRNAPKHGNANNYKMKSRRMVWQHLMLLYSELNGSAKFTTNGLSRWWPDDFSTRRIANQNVCANVVDFTCAKAHSRGEAEETKKMKVHSST